MKPRYNLRISSNNKINATSSYRIRKKPTVRQLVTKNKRANRRHSLRLSPVIKQAQSRSTIPHASAPKCRKIDNDLVDDSSSSTTDTDDYNELLARHHRRMLEEQKDRKLYERYVRDQRTLRRLQCRRTHTAHLSEATRTRLLRELERERRYTIHDQICSHLTNHTFVFRHKQQIHANHPMDWSTLEDELPRTTDQETIRQLDKMMNNLKKVIHPSKSTPSKPRLSVHERQKQRLAASVPDSPVVTSHTNPSQSHESPSNGVTTPNPAHMFVLSRLPVVRFDDDQTNHERMTNPQHLTCIQNVLSQNNQHYSTASAIRKSFLRPKSIYTLSIADSSSPTKKRPLEKENCSLVTSTTNSSSSHTNIVLRAASPMISIKSSNASSSFRSYPNTRKHPIHINSVPTRRQTRVS